MNTKLRYLQSREGFVQQTKLKCFGIFLFGVVLVFIADVKLYGQSVANSVKPATVKYVPLLSQPFMVPQGVANFSNTNRPDVFEHWLENSMSDTERKLQQTNLDATYRQSLEWLLRYNQERLSNHQAQAQKESEFVKSVQSNPQTAWTNLPDPIGEALSSDVAKYEGELVDPSLTPSLRQTDEAMLDNYKQKLADHEANAQLWADLRLALQNHKPDEVMLARKQLADYLRTRLDKIRGKTYPPGMTLDEVMAEYHKQGNGSR